MTVYFEFVFCFRRLQPHDIGLLISRIRDNLISSEIGLLDFVNPALSVVIISSKLAAGLLVDRALQ